jgi:carboxyl-terminal processing protease
VSGKQAPRDVKLERARVDVPVVDAEMQQSGGSKIAHVQLSGFTSGAHGEVRNAIDGLLKKGAQGVVLDLRNNGGGLLNEAVLISSIFIPEGTIVSTEGRARPRRVFEATGNPIDPKIPVVVLVNKESASASEIVTGALQDRGRAEVIGTRTFGKGVFQEVRQLSNGGALDITVGEYFTPKGRNLGGGGVKQGAGIEPDIQAQDDAKTANRDEALEVAVKTVAREAA